MSSSTSFNPVDQTMTLINSTGGVVDFTFAQLDAFVTEQMSASINYGAQAGACITMLLVTAILTNQSKYKKPMFVLNTVSLLLGFLRALLLSLFAVGPFAEMYRVASGDFTTVPESATHLSLVATIVPCLLTVLVNATLLVQANAVIVVMKRRLYHLFLALSFLISLVATGFRVAEDVTNSIAILKQVQYGYDWIQSGAVATEAAAIVYFSLVFSAKLGWMCYTRKLMGMKQWPVHQIFTVTALCTSIVPVIFVGLQFDANFPESGTLVLTIVVLMQPLSSIWATMACTNPEATLNIWEMWNSDNSHAHSLRDSASNSSNTCASSGRQGSLASIFRRNATINNDPEKGTVTVTRAYAVRSE